MLGSLGYLSSFWEETSGEGSPFTLSSAGDARVASLPLMQGNIAWMVIFFSCYLYSLCVFLPDWIKDLRSRKESSTTQSNFDVKPLQIIYNGFQFGIHGVGAVLGLWVMDPSNSWSCLPLSTSTTDPNVMGIIYASYLIFSIKILNLIEPLFTLDDKIRAQLYPEKHEKRGTPHSVLFEGIVLAAKVWLIRTGLKHISHSFIFIALAELIIGTIHYGYQALRSASAEMLPDPKWEKMVDFTRILQLILFLAHGLHLSSVASCSIPKSVCFLECLFSILALSQITLNYAKRVVLRDNYHSSSSSPPLTSSSPVVRKGE